MDKKFSDIKLVDELAGRKKGQFFEIGKKQYKILGFDAELKFPVVAVRILYTTGKPSRKQPICEFFKLDDVVVMTW